MKIAKKILIVLAILITLPFMIALFTSKEYSVQRESIINKPKQEVFLYVKNLKNQEQYNMWVMADPTMKKELKGTDGTVGFVYAWDGNDKAGAGEQEIKTIAEGEKMTTELRFKRPFEGVASTFITTDSISATETKITWGMSGRNPYPFNFMNLFMDKSLGTSMDQSMSLLKKQLEK